jgi:hypothetical protein
MHCLHFEPLIIHPIEEKEQNFNIKLLEVIKQQENQMFQFHPMDFLPF